MTKASDLPQVEFTDPKTVRLISTAYIDEPAMKPLADDEHELKILEEIEGLTSARRSFSIPVPGGLDPAELLTEAAGYGWTYVNAAFCYARATGNRFNGANRGAWYAAYGKLAINTAKAEVAWHISRELEATGVFDNTTSYRELFAGFTSQFHDLSAGANAPALHTDPAIAYPAGQALARDVMGAGGNGILYPSARKIGGKCLVALRPHLVQNIRQGKTWDFVWNGHPTPTIKTRNPDG